MIVRVRLLRNRSDYVLSLCPSVATLICPCTLRVCPSILINRPDINRDRTLHHSSAQSFTFHSHPPSNLLLTLIVFICFLPIFSIATMKRFFNKSFCFIHIYIQAPPPRSRHVNLVSAADPKNVKRQGYLRVEESKDFYLPQTGDEIFYYMEGHREYLKLYPDKLAHQFERPGLTRRCSMLASKNILCSQHMRSWTDTDVPTVSFLLSPFSFLSPA